MSLKEELAKLEEEEQLTEEEDRLNGIQESIYGLYRRIGVIVEYIDKTEKNEKEPTIEEQQRARKLEYELNEKLHHMYNTGIEAGVNYTMERVGVKQH